MKTEINGQIKWFSSEKKYGFITAPGRGDFYFHAIDVNRRWPGFGANQTRV
jgi:cold shock CspA family protein